MHDGKGGVNATLEGEGGFGTSKGKAWGGWGMGGWGRGWDGGKGGEGVGMGAMVGVGKDVGDDDDDDDDDDDSGGGDEFDIMLIARDKEKGFPTSF